MLSLTQIMAALTKEQGLAYVLAGLQSMGFETTGWQDGRIQKTIARIIGLGLADLSELGRIVVEFGVNDYSSGAPLKEFSRSRYQNEYQRAIATVGPARLRSTSSTPYTIQPGQLIASTPAGVQYRNTTGGTLLAGSSSAPTTLQLQWECRQAGSVGNVGRNTITRLVTPLAGVTIANDEGDPWWTTAGQDEEPDEALKERNRTKWSLLSIELVKEAYEQVARDAGARKVVIDDQNPRGPGTVDVYVSDETALLGTTQMQAIQLAFSRRVFHTSSSWPPPATSAVTVKHPGTHVLDLSGALYHDPNISSASAHGFALAALRDFIRRTPLGGWDYTPGPARVVLREDLADTVKNVEGIRTLVLASPTGTVNVAANALVVEGSWVFSTIPVQTTQQA